MAQGMVFEDKNSITSLEDFMIPWDSINSKRVEENVLVEALICRKGEAGREEKNCFLAKGRTTSCCRT